MTESNISNLSQADIDSVGSKLASWADSLPESERSLAQLLVEHSRQLTPGNVMLRRIAADMRASAMEIVRGINLPRTPVAWAKVGPVWQRAIPRQAEYDFYGDDVELIQQVIVTQKR
jgi:hypothetical protein